MEKKACSRHCTDGEDMNRSKKRVGGGSGQGQVIVIKWKSSRTESGKRCLELAGLQDSAVHFEGKNSCRKKKI